MRKKNVTELRQLNVIVPRDLHQALKAVAALTGVPLGELAASALQYFAGSQKPELEDLHKRCAEAGKSLGRSFDDCSVLALSN